MSKENYSKLLEEMLELADVPINEQDDEDEEDNKEADAEDEEKGKEAEDEKDDDKEEELLDEWEKQIKTGSTLRIQFHTNYIYVWYRNKKSNRIMIPQKLRPYKDLVSSLFEDVLSHVETTS